MVLNAHANSQSHAGAVLLGLISTLSSARVKWKVMESVCVNLAFSHSASRPFIVICCDFNNPCQTPNSSPHSSAAAYSRCPSPWRGRQEAQHSFSLHKGRPVQLDKYYFPPLTASPVKLVLYYFSISSSRLRFPLLVMLPPRHCEPLWAGAHAQPLQRGNAVLNLWFGK